MRIIDQAQTISDLPSDVRALLNYQYPLALLFAVASFGAVYFWLSLKTDQRWLIAISCLVPIYSYYLWLAAIPLLVFIIFCLLIWSTVLFFTSNYQLLIPYLYCLVLNSIAAIMLWQHGVDLFNVID